MRWLFTGKFPAALIPILLVAGCGDDRNDVNEAAAKAAAPVFRADGALADLTGLWEDGPLAARSQMCIVENSGGPARFALLRWGKGDRSCSGGGTVERDGKVLRFTMAGESACAFDARLNGTGLTIDGEVPSGCAYYCTAGTSLAGARFTLVAPSIEDALRARDLVGEPLCGGSS